MSAKDRLKQRLEAKPTKRRFRGWKATLVAQTEEFSVNVPIRYQKITSSSIDEAMNIVALANGKTVERKLLGEYHYGYVTEDGEEVQKEDIVYYQLIEGEEPRAVEQFERTKEFEITKDDFVEREKLWNYLLENFYEVWSEKNGLWLLAEYLNNKTKLAICRHVVLRKSFKEHYGLIFPVVIGDEYTLVMALTRMNLQYKHLRPAKPIAEAEKPEALKTKPKSVLEIEF